MMRPPRRAGASPFPSATGGACRGLFRAKPSSGCWGAAVTGMDGDPAATGLKCGGRGRRKPSRWTPVDTGLKEKPKVESNWGGGGGALWATAAGEEQEPALQSFRGRAPGGGGHPSEAGVGPAGPPYPAPRALPRSPHLPPVAVAPASRARRRPLGSCRPRQAPASAPRGSVCRPGSLPSSLLESCPGDVLRENVLRNLAHKAFEQPICEALLDQRFFNGIGNYLRAEILHRLGIPPFEKARTVLEALQQRRPSPEQTLSQKIRAKLQSPDLLELCHSVPKEVVQLGGKGYGPESGEEDFAAFRAWLRCYGVPGMSSLRDRRGRTIWFQGDPGPLAPKGGKSRKKKPKGAQQGPEHRTEGPLLPSAARSRSRGARRGPPEQGTAQQPEGTSLQQDPEVPLAPVKGRRRRQPAASGGPSSAGSPGERRGWPAHRGGGREAQRWGRGGRRSSPPPGLSCCPTCPPPRPPKTPKDQGQHPVLGGGDVSLLAGGPPRWRPPPAPAEPWGPGSWLQAGPSCWGPGAPGRVALPCPTMMFLSVPPSPFFKSIQKML
uniref:Nei like DNA glycosylase 1 n=1 Tax=Canis lupus familiaris TaxID=9615 RepID=A0A8P0T9A7_CANLF